MTHFVYVWIKQGTQWDELFYSIKSLHKFFQGPKKIFVVGDKPPIRGVIHLPHQRVRNTHNPKAVDSVNKLLHITNTDLINEDFVYMYDDIILLRNCSEKDFAPTRAIDFVPTPEEYFLPGRGPSPTWKRLFLRSMATLQRHKLPTWNYETHLPRIYNKEKVLEVITKYRFQKHPLLFATMYFNTYHEQPDQVLRTNDKIKVGLYEPHQMPFLKSNISGKLFLSYNDSAINDNFKKFIKDYLK